MSPAEKLALVPASFSTMKRIFFLTLAVLALARPRLAASRDLSIAETGAVADATTLNTDKIQSAIDQLATNGGGTVVIPKGVFLTGAIFLKPGVNLHLDKDAVLKGTTNMTNYPERRIRIEGHFEEHYTPALVNAEACDGLQITGEGTLDGTGMPIWELFWALRRASPNQRNFANIAIPRAQLCIINNSKNVLVDGITFKDSQFWNLHLYKSSNITVQNARFQVPDDYRQAPSTDGIDVDSCQSVEIKGCYFSVTDDCIALKGSKGPDALNDTNSPPVEHIHVSNCTYKRGGGVLTLGSEATIVRDVVVENCQVVGPVNVAVFKLRPDTPQHYEDIHFRHITLDNDRGTIIGINPWTQFFDLKGQPPPKSIVTNISFSDIKGRSGALGNIQGNPGQSEISDILLTNFDVQLMQGQLRTANAKNLKFENVTVNGKPLESPAQQ
jgi:alpha-L-rhamnosidase